MTPDAAFELLSKISYKQGHVLDIQRVPLSSDIRITLSAFVWDSLGSGHKVTILSTETIIGTYFRKLTEKDFHPELKGYNMRLRS